MSEERETSSDQKKKHQYVATDNSLLPPTNKKIKWDHPSIILHPPAMRNVDVRYLPESGEFQLPSINKVPHIWLIIEIARYIPRRECRHVFRRILPSREYRSVYDLVDAEQVSRNLLRSFHSKRSQKKVSGPCTLIYHGKDEKSLFPGGLGTFVESIVPNYETFREEKWRKNGKMQ